MKEACVFTAAGTAAQFGGRQRIVFSVFSGPSWGSVVGQLKWGRVCVQTWRGQLARAFSPYRQGPSRGPGEPAWRSLSGGCAIRGRPQAFAIGPVQVVAGPEGMDAGEIREAGGVTWRWAGETGSPR